MADAPTKRTVVSLAADGAVVVDLRGLSAFTVITGAGATATVSRVDSPTATAHTTGAENSFTVAAATKTTTTADWPFVRISVAGGTCRVGIV